MGQHVKAPAHGDGALPDRPRRRSVIEEAVVVDALVAVHESDPLSRTTR
jgi:hypothetical protein